MSNYIYDLPDWPRFRWNQEAIFPRLTGVRHKQDRLIGRMQALGFTLRWVMSRCSVERSTSPEEARITAIADVAYLAGLTGTLQHFDHLASA